MQTAFPSLMLTTHQVFVFPETRQGAARKKEKRLKMQTFKIKKDVLTTARRIVRHQV